MTNLLTTEQAAARLGVSPRRVRAMIAAGRLAAQQVGRDWLISPEAIRDYRPGRPGRRPKAQG